MRVLARRSICSTERALSTSLWKLGTSARLPPCRCAAALRHGHRAPAHAQLLSGAATSRVRVLARRSLCSMERALSTSLWKLGTSARSPHGGAPPPCVRVTGLLHTHSCSGSGHKPCACAGAAQYYVLLARAPSTSPVEAWDVGQVTNMRVRRRPASGSQGSCTHTPLWGPQAMCVCWRGAVYVLLRKHLQPALGSMGRRPGHQHGGAPPPCVMVTGLLHTHSCSAERPQAVCVCWRGAVYVLWSERFQPACGSLGRRPGYLT